MVPPLKCEIILDKSSKIYFPSEPIKGHLALNLKSALNITKLELHLAGSAKYSGGSPFQIFCEAKYVNINKIIPSGVVNFPINWTLPHDITPSFKWSRSGLGVNYLFSAFVHLKSGGQVIKSTSDLAFEVHSLCEIGRLGFHLTSAEEYKAVFHDQNVGGTGGDIFIRFVLNRRAFIPQEHLKFNVALACKAVREWGSGYALQSVKDAMKRIKVTLEQEDSYFANQNEKFVKSKIWERSGSISSRGRGENPCFVWEDSIKIPNPCLSTNSNPLLNVSYFLNVTTRTTPTFEGEQVLTLFRFPIIIGTIPMDQPLLAEVQMALITSKALDINDFPQRSPSERWVGLLIEDPYAVEEEEEYVQEEDEQQQIPSGPPPTYLAAIGEEEEPPPDYSYAIRQVSLESM